ncbi:hypothetical protein B0H63DRAFT_199402 [Podospora didyma]|uniref:DNA/RNA-binding protein Alba-like domain-containing protein n=1 Tax=Podospora didyma TaxID=330526 RepID=A0AAE0NGW5_9PEZI|nr:hypothetical protein B0H63DRAFT_199402 [Podospora didyma]
MPAADPMLRLQPAILPKRRYLDDENIQNDPNPKKRRVESGPRTTAAPTAGLAESPFTQLYGPLLSRLKPKYEVKPMVVRGSTSISKHVDRALEHLGRFSMWDLSVLPGVVLLCARSGDSSKLISVSELVRRRISETEQKWFQYNLLDETVCEDRTIMALEEPSIVEDTFMAVGTVDTGYVSDSESDNGYFETANRQPTIHERATEAAKFKHKAYMTVLLSRVPLHELKDMHNIALQTNEHHIEYLRKKKMGLVG